MNTRLIGSMFLVFATVCPSSAFADDTDDLLDAASRGDINRVQSLLSGGTDVNAAKTDGVTALWVAAHDGHTEVVKVLLEAGADVKAKAHAGGKDDTPLSIAKQMGHTAVIKLLKKHGAKD